MTDRGQSHLASAAAVAGVYAYFLLFAQFALLARMREVIPEGVALKAVLAVMAIAGIASGFLVARRDSSRRWFLSAQVLAVVAACLAAVADGLMGFACVAVMTGAAIGTATVSLAAMLANALKSPRGCWWLGWGTGVAYGLCNLPWFFNASPKVQCAQAAGIAVATLLAGWRMPDGASDDGSARIPWRAIVVFSALVWLDSAVFYIIQHTLVMKSATWSAWHLWQNAGVHLTAAVLGGWWLSRGGIRSLLLTAGALLALASVWLNMPAMRWCAGMIYPAAVSLYSTALVAWPALLAKRDSVVAARGGVMKQAAWLFGLAGWVASAMGIGMAESLHEVPWLFILAAGGAICMATLGIRVNLRFLAVACVVVVGTWFSPRQRVAPIAAVDRGRQVYLAEGCIHCHSSYVRPDTIDEEIWGRAPAAQEMAGEHPVLIGNRRQGPDLLRVGGRRSASWLKQHFLSPQTFSPGSAMPSYAYLFENERGNDLIAYLLRHQADDAAWQWRLASTWRPATGVHGNVERGRQLYVRSCAICHGEQGHGDGRMKAALSREPRNLVQGPFAWSVPSESGTAEASVMRVIKFGIPGTDMPGHETWSDPDLSDLAAYVLQLRQQ